MADQFREAEASFSLLREKFKEKRISPQEFADSLKQLRITDEEGRFWVIGAQSGKWYAFENGEWVEAKPPAQLEKKAICIACGFENDLESESCARCGSPPDEIEPESGVAVPEAAAPDAVPADPAGAGRAVTIRSPGRHVLPYNTYKNSVHGSALTNEGNQYVPTCIDCHGVHNVQNPTTNSFRNSTPGLCANCHTNETLMKQYGISTNVLNSYVSDFHGTTVKMFEESYPDQPTNKPVCTDCHGIHDIMKPDDPQAGIALKSNLLVKCQQCHPDATTETFTDSWLSHYEPSPQAFPIVYYVNLFYKIFIPAVLGGMIFYILTDIYRRFIVPRLRGGKGDSHK